MKYFVALVSGLCLAMPALAAKPDLNSFEDVRFEHHADAAHGFAIDYPYLWNIQKPTRPGEVFSVADPGRMPSLIISVRKRMDAVPFQQSAVVAASALGKDVKIISNRETGLGSVAAQEAVAEWILPYGRGIKMRTMMVSVYRGDEWILIAGNDAQAETGFVEDLIEAIYSTQILTPAQGDDR